MHPQLVAFHVPLLGWFVDITAYPFFHFLALLAVLGMGLWIYRRDVGPIGPAVDVYLIAVPAGLLGAPFLAFAVRGKLTLSLTPALYVGSKAAYGGILFGLGAALVVAWLRRIPIRAFFDAVSPGIAVGAALCRVGCFMAGCCYGQPTSSSLGVRFPEFHRGMLVLAPHDPQALHPTQLYLAAAALGIAAVLLMMRRKKIGRPGARFLVLAILYAASVFAVEFLRADPGRFYAYGLSHSQWISVAVLLAIAVGQVLGRLRDAHVPAARAVAHGG